ncbi:hypothetical protein [Streptomyces sp. NPDC096132]|uniref:hypothetical protein n=1 Tax=Streptomyces sp. NPDC096132 TaxID=3366075 RepID=UPI00382B9ACE
MPAGRRRTVVGEMVRDLDDVAAARRDHGPRAVLGLLGSPAPAPFPVPAAVLRRTLADGIAGARLRLYADRIQRVL